MKKGNPAAALAIIASIFGAAGAVCLLPEAEREQLLSPQPLPSRAVFVTTALATPVDALSVVVDESDLPAQVAPPVVARNTLLEARVVDSVVLPLQFSNDPGTPPALAATHLSLLSATAEPIPAEPLTIDDRRLGPVPAAFDRTGSALALAFRKTGASVKTAFSVLTP